MAIQTVHWSTVADGLGNTATVEYDYDDVSLLVTAVRCINNTAKAALTTVWRLADPSVRYSKRTAANTTDSVAIPSQQATRIQLTVVNTSHGPRLDGLDGTFEWPVA